MMRTRFLVLLAMFLMAFVACESDSGGSGGGSGATPDPDEGKVAKATIVAADGGEVKTESGNATVNLPAGALTEDTEISIEVAPAEADTAASVYDFKPDGQQFEKPVTISLAFDGEAGENKKAVLGTYDEEAKKWVEVPNSALAGGVVSGDVNHFSKYSIIIVDDQVVLVSECADLLTNFQACGGDPTGDWDFTDLCFPPEMLGSNPFAESCPEAKVDFEVTWNANISFKGDGTTEMLFSGTSMESTYDIPLSCLTAPMDCATLGEQIESPCEETGGNCVCNAKTDNVNENPEPELGGWSVNGDKLTLVDDDGESTDNPFCVEGDTMRIHITEEPDPEDPGDSPDEYVVVLKKK